MQVFARKRGLPREHVSGTFSTRGFFHTRGQPLSSHYRDQSSTAAQLPTSSPCQHPAAKCVTVRPLLSAREGAKGVGSGTGLPWRGHCCRALSRACPCLQGPIRTLLRCLPPVLILFPSSPSHPPGQYVRLAAHPSTYPSAHLMPAEPSSHPTRLLPQVHHLQGEPTRGMLCVCKDHIIHLYSRADFQSSHTQQPRSHSPPAPKWASTWNIRASPGLAAKGEAVHVEPERRE